MDIHWYKTFFHGIVLDFWRQAVSPGQTKTEVEFLERALQLEKGMRVLDVASGLGRHAVGLASRGYNITGVDLSADAITEAQRNASEAGVNVEWIHADMKDLPFVETFDGAFCFGNSFGFLPPEETRAFVASLGRALKPGARFAMDTGIIAESVLPNFKEHDWAQVGDILFLEENRYHLNESCVETIFTFVRDGETYSQTGLQYVYTLRELRDLFAGAGIEPVHFYGSLQRVPYELKWPYAFMVAERR